MKSKTLTDGTSGIDAAKDDAVKGSDWFAQQLDKYKDDPEFRAEGLILKINEELCRLMEDQQINRAELARRLGVQRQFITKILNGTPNLTLLTLVKAATALKCHVDFQFVPDVAKEPFTACESIVADINDIAAEWDSLPPLNMTGNEGGRLAIAYAA